MANDRERYKAETPPWPMWAVIAVVVVVTMVLTILLFILIPSLFGYHVVLEPQ